MPGHFFRQYVPIQKLLIERSTRVCFLFAIASNQKRRCVYTTMQKCELITFTACMLFSLGIAQAADEDLPPCSGKTVQRKIKEIQVEKVTALTGPDSPVVMKPLSICGTDLAP
jgi:hypothetical protein